MTARAAFLPLQPSRCRWVEPGGGPAPPLGNHAHWGTWLAPANGSASSSSRPFPLALLRHLRGGGGASERKGAGSSELTVQRRLAPPPPCPAPIGRSRRRSAGLKSGRGGCRRAMEAVPCAEHGEQRGRGEGASRPCWASRPRPERFLLSPPCRVPLLPEDGRPRWPQQGEELLRVRSAGPGGLRLRPPGAVGAGRGARQGLPAGVRLRGDARLSRERFSACQQP